MKLLLPALAFCLVSAQAAPRKCGTRIPAQRPLAKLSAVASAAPQILKVAVLRIGFSDAPFTQDSAAMAATNAEIARFFRENSSGRLDMRLTLVPGVVNSAKKRADYDQDDDFYAFAEYVEGRLQAANLVQGRDWDRYLVSFSEIGALDWVGLSGGLESPDNWVNGHYDAAVAAHELGHTLGLPHSSSVEAGSNALPSNPDAGDFYEYGDVYDIMGDGNLSGHFSTIFKDALGWLAPSEIQDGTALGTFRIHAHDHEVRSGKTLAVKIKSGKGYDYWLEYRNTVDWNGNNAEKGVAVRLDGYLEYNPLLLDMSPGSRSGDADFDDAGLELNKEYADRFGAFRIRTVALSQGAGGQDDWVEVLITSANAALARHPASRAPGAGAGRFSWHGVIHDPLGRKAPPARRPLLP